MAHGLSCSTECGNLPRPGLEPVSPALAGGFSTTAPPGKPYILFYKVKLFITSPLSCHLLSEEEKRVKILFLRLRMEYVVSLDTEASSLFV